MCFAYLTVESVVFVDSFHSKNGRVRWYVLRYGHLVPSLTLKHGSIVIFVDHVDQYVDRATVRRT